MFNDICVCSVAQVGNTATSEVRADGVGFSKTSRLHIPADCAACKSDASGFGGLHETGNYSLGRLTLWGNERGVVLLLNIWQTLSMHGGQVIDEQILQTECCSFGMWMQD